MSALLKRIFPLIIFVITLYAYKADFYLFSAAGCVDTIRVKYENFDWEDYPDFDFAFIEPDSKSDSSFFLIKGVPKGQKPDSFLCSYRADWKEIISGNSRKIMLGKEDSIGMNLITADLLFMEVPEDSLPFRFFKPDLRVMGEQCEVDYIDSINRSPILVFSDKHYPTITWLSYNEDPEEVRLEPLKFGYFRASYRYHYIRRIRAIRAKPCCRKLATSKTWCKVPLLLDDEFNQFKVKKFGFWSKKISLYSGEKESLQLKKWLYFNPSIVWVVDDQDAYGPYPSDVVLGVDISGAIPGLQKKAISAGFDYEIVLSPFPTALKTGITWFYGDLWSSELYYIFVLDSNPFRPTAHGWITEHELSGKVFLGRNVWKYFPFIIKAGFGQGKTSEPSIYKMRFLENPEAKYAEGYGLYLSGGFEFWFLKSALLRPTIEVGVAWGNGKTISKNGLIISKSDSTDDRTYPFVRLNFKH
ncbi:hypothetical protein KAH81_07580 [bacterium]|nr:hypothetical protein [bacterium]